MLQSQPCYLIGIAGGSGSGKTTFSHKIQSLVGKSHTSIFSMDSYYLPTIPMSIYSRQGRPNYDHPNAFDWELIIDHLKLIKSGKDISSPCYDFSTSSRSQNEFNTITARPIIIVEGIFSLFLPEIRDILDIKCFINVDADMRFTRRLHRDKEERGRDLSSIIDQYYDTVRPMYQKYLAPQQQFADIIIGEENDVAASIIAAKLRCELDSMKSSHITTGDSSLSYESESLQ